jgi:hypothetical protein
MTPPGIIVNNWPGWQPSMALPAKIQPGHKSDSGKDGKKDCHEARILYRTRIARSKTKAAPNARARDPDAQRRLLGQRATGAIRAQRHVAQSILMASRDQTGARLACRSGIRKSRKR